MIQRPLWEAQWLRLVNIHGNLELRRYVFSCGLLLLPIFAWNVAFARFLPSALATSDFWRAIPSSLVYAENAFRLIVSVLPFLMPLERRSSLQGSGLVIYGIGAGLYFSSWMALMIVPNSLWATSAIGFLAPAYTPAVWLVGLALLGQRLYWGTFYRWWWFLFPTSGFIIAHVMHTALVYARAS